MYRRDLITAEIQRLAQVLSKIMGLKLDGNFKEAQILFDETLENGFNLPSEILVDQDISVFKNWLHASDLPPEKLDTLSEFLYYELGVSAERNQIIAPKLNLVYQYLSDQHKIVHLVNLHRQKTIQQYLS
ncbi:hypothetical protein EZ449_17065 [Pedobacter frigidisoli]|uniref:Uncharacterized protein n=1 Tax=Pedobacter frigidisoli TaxID=2530455 RepID=A0A4R0NTL9_9SPHI|nr:hypothetical protein [Pedobacter frigidisoli]TCD04659.1 hypothetical protein EZ449_17065 [Pedobacter frigidisoli]